MYRDIFIAIALGLVSAIAFVSATTGTALMKLVLFLLSSLPLMLAGLGWGTQAVLIAGLSGSMLLAIFGAPLAVIFLASQALPATVLTYLARLSRPVDTSENAPREWYPPGRLVMVAAGLSAIVAAAAAIMAEPMAEEIKAAFVKALEPALTATHITGQGGAPLTPEQIAGIAAQLYTLIPPMSAIAWMSGLLTSLWLAARVMRSSGMMARPWPDLGGLLYPAGTMLAYAAAALATMTEGTIAIAGRALFGALSFAYVLLGLSIVHYITRGLSWRTPALVVLYGALLFMSGVPLVPLIMLGLSDRLFDLRARFGGPPTPPQPNIPT